MANTSVTLSTFQKSINAFKTKAGLTPDELRDFQLTTLDDLKVQMAIIQNDQRKSKKLQYLKRLGPFLDTMEQYGKIVEVFLNLHEVVAFVWGPMKFLLMVAKNYTDAFNALLDAYLEIGQNMPQFSQYQTLFQDNVHMQLALAHIFEDILEFHKEALRYFRQRSWKELFHATWRSFSNTVAHLMNDLHRHKSLIESQASIVEYELMQNLRAQSQRQFEEQRLAELDRKRLSVQQWLCPLDARTRHEDAARKRHGNSGDWIFKHATFETWYDFNYGNEPLLWLSGIPGAGKTVLASRIIDECHSVAHIRTTFFYCQHTDDERNAFVAVARTMLSQLVVGNDLLLQLIYERATKSSEASLTSIQTAKELLDTALKTYDKTRKTYIVIDGLDEYDREDRKEISAWFKEQVRNVPTKDLGQLRCLFISQDDGYARKDMSDCSSLKLKVELTHHDIEAYCKMWHQRIEERFKALDPKEHNISEMVTARAQGMFLYAKLVNMNLYEQPNRKLFFQELRPDTLPGGLNQAYDRIIERIIGPNVLPRSRSVNARKLLGWLTCAKRTLKWREVQGAVSIDLDDGTLCTDLQFQDDCKDLCASLVERTTDGSVALVHSTARNYLLDKGHVNQSRVEYDLAHLCLSYLSFDHFTYQNSQDNIRTAIEQGAYAFADYASCFWAHHLVAGVRDLLKISSRSLDDLTAVIEAFLHEQWASPKKRLTVSKTLVQDFSALESEDMYESICQAVVSTKNQLLTTGKGPSDDEPLHLPETIHTIRAELERMISAPTTADIMLKLKEFYGSDLFKCRRLNCYYYSCGFATEAQRDKHTAKHERPFPCTVEGCPHATIGCITAQDLQRHMKEYHGTALDADAEYPADEPEPDTATQSRTQKHPATFQCTLCPRRFTRAYNLRSHLRTHTDERPFVCSVCGKGFARQHDRKRHEGLHAGEKNFVCRGNLKDGNHWGCDRRFARAEALGRHMRSEGGRACIRPLLEEEAMEKGDWGLGGNGSQPGTFAEVLDANQYGTASTQNPPHMLPAALLQQYPVLADIDWDQSPPESGQADSVSPPGINIDFAPPSREAIFEPQPENQEDAPRPPNQSE